MKKLFIVTAIVVTVLGFSLESQADLLNRGTDSLGNRLIYDSDRKITWYDFTYSYLIPGPTSWDNSRNWASSLSVTFNGIEFNDWRLPTITINQDPATYGYSGSDTYGYNIKNSEMGHLFYTALGNKAYYATNGSYPQSGWGLTSTGDFQHLYAEYYYSDATYSYNVWAAVYQSFATGEQYAGAKVALGGTGIYAMAVRDGDVAAVPIPPTVWLLGSGLVGLVGLRRKFRK